MYIKVKALAGVKTEKIMRKSENQFEIHVKEPAERNLANARIIEIIAGIFVVPKNKVRIINGHHSGSKMLSVDFN